MRKFRSNFVSSFFLSVLLVFLVVALSGCGSYNEPPEANISTNPSASDGTVTINAGGTVDFDATGSEDTDGSIVSYEWDFDDGVTTSDAQVSHIFNEKKETTKEYIVTLTVTDDGGAQSTAEIEIVAEVIEPPPPPG